MDYAGYAALFVAGFFTWALFSAIRLSASYKKMEQYANHLRAVANGTEQRNTALLAENSRLRIKNHALQRTIEEQDYNAQYRTQLNQA